MINRVRTYGTGIALGLVCALLMPSAHAQHHHGYGGHGGGLWGLGLGLGLGWEIASVGRPYPYGYYGYYGYPAYPVYPAYSYAYPYPYQYSYPYAVASAPVPYPAPAPAPPPAAPRYAQPAANWYYCDSARGYYPYVAQCAEGWRTVPSVPPGAVR